jgi:hypothetical protein
MLPIPLDIILDITGPANPATYTPAGGTAKDVVVLFRRDGKDNPLAGIGYENTAPAAWIKAEDAPDIAKGDTLAIHDLWEEDGQYVVTEKGELIIIENIYVYYIVGTHESETGLIQVDLSLDAIS